jgi:hypothetical protein
MHVTLNSETATVSFASVSKAGALALLMLLSGAAVSQSIAETAYINQANTKSFGAGSFQPSSPSTPIPVPQYGPRQTAFIPTPETAAPAQVNGNLAQTLQVGNFNKVLQLQAGKNNISDVGIIGNNNNVGVLQGGHDLSNLYLVNTQGMSIGVIQPANAAPVNMLIARLPNGALLIKR